MADGTGRSFTTPIDDAGGPGALTAPTTPTACQMAGPGDGQDAGHDHQPARTSLRTKRAPPCPARAFAEPAVASEVLGQVQVLTLTPALARLNYATPYAGQAALAGLITGSPPVPPPGHTPISTIPNGSRGVAHPPGTSPGTSQNNRHPALGLADLPAVPITRLSAGHPGASPPATNGQDSTLVDAATRIVAEARRHGVQLSQAALAAQLRAQGYRIAKPPPPLAGRRDRPDGNP